MSFIKPISFPFTVSSLLSVTLKSISQVEEVTERSIVSFGFIWYFSGSFGFWEIILSRFAPTVTLHSIYIFIQ